MIPEWTERREKEKMYLLNPKGLFWSWLSNARATQACTAAL